MQNLDFLPERTRLQRQRRRRLFRQGYLTVVCIAGLVAVGYMRQGSVRQAQASLESLNTQQQQLQRQVSMKQDLERQLGEFQLLKRINDDLGSRVCALDVLAELDKLLPRNMALTHLSFEAVQLQVPLKQGSGGADPTRAVTVSDPGKMMTVKRVRLMLTGIAPSDVDVANFIGQLSASPLLEDVNMGYAKTVDFRGRLAREFQASCYITP
jgi:Tfp pilus assembly protein PilN